MLVPALSWLEVGPGAACPATVAGPPRPDRGTLVPVQYIKQVSSGGLPFGLMVPSRGGGGRPACRV